jgi:hypothetical protein
MDGLTGRIIASTPEKDTEQVALTMFWALLFGIVAVCVSLWGEGTIWRGLLWAGAWSSIGWFLGFLFGIPRFLSTDTARTPGATALERAKQDVAAAAELSKAKRIEADAAASAKAAADKTASDEADRVTQAVEFAAEAVARADAAPQDQMLADAARAAGEAAEKAKLKGQEAMSLAKATAEKAAAAESAAADAATAAEKAKANEAKAGTDATVAPRASLTVNTNLEQISDWLTKIIVGVSLVESQSLLETMRRAATFMAKSMARPGEVAAWIESSAVAPSVRVAASAAEAAASAVTAASAPVSGASAAATAAAHAMSSASFSSMESVAYAIMVYFLATGLLGSYLLTRLFLQRALDNAAAQG